MRNSSSIDWTDAVIARLRALWAEGHSTVEIGRRLGISKNAVVGKVHRLNLPGRPSPIRKDGSTRTQPRRVRSERVPLPVLAAVRPPGPQAASPSASVAVPVEIAAIDRSSAPTRWAGRVQECCWPIGQPGRIGFRFCSDPSEPGKPYCPEHCRSAYVRSSRPKEPTTSALR